MMRFAVPILSVLVAAGLVASCAVPEARLRGGLIRAGLPKPLSACMAERMVDRLSIRQLWRISDLARASNAGSVDQFVHRVRALDDPQIASVTAAAAVRCTTGI